MLWYSLKRLTSCLSFSTNCTFRSDWSQAMHTQSANHSFAQCVRMIGTQAWTFYNNKTGQALTLFNMYSLSVYLSFACLHSYVHARTVWESQRTHILVLTFMFFFLAHKHCTHTLRLDLREGFLFDTHLLALTHTRAEAHSYLSNTCGFCCLFADCDSFVKTKFQHVQESN
jgi:hypothetical protein